MLANPPGFAIIAASFALVLFPDSPGKVLRTT
jgi:hypothetical protein